MADWRGLIYGSNSLFGRNIPVRPAQVTSDRTTLRRGGKVTSKTIPYDGVVTFDRSASLALSGVGHDETQPSHLMFKNQQNQLENLHGFGLEPAQYYCPAGVYEVRRNAQDKHYIHISSSNCLHCKMCDLKDPADNIIWRVPPSGGPNYVDM